MVEKKTFVRFTFEATGPKADELIKEQIISDMNEYNQFPYDEAILKEFTFIDMEGILKALEEDRDRVGREAKNSYDRGYHMALMAVVKTLREMLG